MGCLVCGAGAEVGALCRACAQQVPPCDGLIPDHVRSTVSAADDTAYVVDGFGHAHALAPKTAAGRNQTGQLVVLGGSVSREHAELKRTDSGWQIRDTGSRNGTFVDGVRTTGRVALPGRCVIKLGDVALWFLPEVAHLPSDNKSMATVAPNRGLVRFLIQRDQVELCVVGNGDLQSGGALLSRPVGTDEWNSHDLAPLEFQLLRALCTQAIAEASSPDPARGCIATDRLAQDLPFQARWPNEENVRQVVRRLRSVLVEAGTDARLVDVKPGRGYFIASPVSVDGR